MVQKIKEAIQTNAAYLAWVIALVGTFGSLYLSEIQNLPPCVLCWYQRTMMYPLALILPVGILTRDRKLPLYVLPFTIIGSLISIYHYLLQRGVIPDELGPCVEGISCTTKQIEWLGFITIPFMALVAFAAITILMIIVWKKRHD